MKKQSIIFLIGLLILFCDLTFAEEKEKIAVATFDAKGVPVTDAEIVANFLRSDLVNTQKFTVLDRTNMDKILNEQKFQMSGCTSMECAVEVGRILNVMKMVVGTHSIILIIGVMDSRDRFSLVLTKVGMSEQQVIYGHLKVPLRNTSRG